MQRREEVVAIEVPDVGMDSLARTSQGEEITPLKIRRSPSEWCFIILRYLVHLAAVGCYGYTGYVDTTFYGPLLNDWELLDEGLLSHFQSIVLYKLAYLSNWNMILQLVYFSWCVISDLIAASAEGSSIAKAATRFRDWLLAAAVFPIGTLVVTTFWLIYAIDRELIFPEKMDRFFPAWLNHALHTFVLPLLLLEMFLDKHKYPSRTSGMLGTISFGLAYLIWVMYLGFAQSIWVYPFLEVLEGPYFVLFFAVTTTFLLLLYYIGEKVNNLLGGGKGSESRHSPMQKID